MPEYNFIMAGRVGVGKSTLFHLIKTGIAPKLDQYDDTYDDTPDYRSPYDDLGLEIFKYDTEVNGRHVRVNLWDTGGQERYDSMTANYYRHAHAVILVYDLTAEDTLYPLTDWIKEARKYSRWSDRLMFALWGNKSDIASSSSDEAMLAFMASQAIPLELGSQVSAKVEGSVERAFDTLIKNVDKQFNQVGTDGEEQHRDSRLFMSMEEEALFKQNSTNRTNRCPCS